MNYGMSIMFKNETVWKIYLPINKNDADSLILSSQGGILSF